MLVETDAGPAPWVLIRASGDQKYSELIRVAEAVQAAGIKVLRFEPIEGGR